MIQIIGSGAKMNLSNAVVLTVAGVILAITVAFYVLRSIGLFVLAKKNGVKYAFVSWIPIGWIYVVATLAGRVTFFGRPMKNFVMIASTVFVLSEICTLTVNIIIYAPIIGYYLQGLNGSAEIYYVISNKGVLPSGTVSYRLISGLYTATNFVYPYEDGIIPFLNAMNIVEYVLSIVSFVGLIVAYTGLFKSFWPEHFLLGTILSLLGLFPIVVFAVRNRQAVDYNEFMRNRIASMYGNPNGFNRTGGNGGYNSDGNNASSDPFGEFDAKKTDGESTDGGNADDDPFGGLGK